MKHLQDEDILLRLSKKINEEALYKNIIKLSPFVSDC